LVPSIATPPKRGFSRRESSHPSPTNARAKRPAENLAPRTYPTAYKSRHPSPARSGSPRASPFPVAFALYRPARSTTAKRGEIPNSPEQIVNDATLVIGKFVASIGELTERRGQFIEAQRAIGSGALRMRCAVAKTTRRVARFS